MKEADGMDEGWSDAFAEWLQHKDASIPDFVIGAFVDFVLCFLRLISVPVGSTTNPAVSGRSHILLARMCFCRMSYELLIFPQHHQPSCKFSSERRHASP